MTAFYNEIDPFAAAWLRQLIEYGHIAPGIVDERSIEDIRPDELAGYTQVHFFAGIGGWSYALRLAGWPDDRPIWTASCPCQPFSAAGKGGGFDDERHLWPALYWHIFHGKPQVVIGEQVASKDGLAWWELVSSDLEIAGYANAAVDFCAASVGAPHIRQRLYWMAYAAESGRFTRWRSGSAGDGRGSPWIESGRLRDAVRLDDTVGARLEGFGSGYSSEIGRNGTFGPVAQASEFGGMADAASNGRFKGQPNGSRDASGITAQGEFGRSSEYDDAGGMADADGRNTGTEGLQRSVEQRQFQEDGRVSRMANPDDGQFPQPWRGSQGRNGSGTTGQVDDVGRSSPTNGFWRNADWVFCRDGKWRPVEPSYVKVADGSSEGLGRMRDNSASADAQETQEIIRPSPLARNEIARTQRLRGYGNAIVAPQAQAFIETVMEIL